MKLSEILAPMIAAKVPHDVILDTVRAYETDKSALLARLVPAGRRIRSRQWGKIRLRIMERDRFVCSYCRAGATDVDHVVPIKAGGSNEDDNLVASCGHCNRSKGAKTLSEWRAQH